MRKEFLFLLLLFPLATMFKSSYALAADPPTSEYSAAMAAITDGEYYLVTKVGETKWYVTQYGYLTNNKESAYLFAISKDSGGALYDDGILIEPGNGAHFSNTNLGDDEKAVLNPTETCYRQDGSNNRNDWERQVFYLKDGKYAIRTSNTVYDDSGWADAGRVFWTYKKIDESNAITPCYSYEPAYIWTLELPTVTFEDNNVKAICVSNWDTDDDGELNENEVAAVTDLGEAFKNNTSITSFNDLQYFSGLKTIGANSFEGCSGLTSITIPEGVTSIGNSAFKDCINLKSVISLAEPPASLGEDAFANISSDCSLTVSKGSKRAYIEKGWTVDVFGGGIYEEGINVDGFLKYQLDKTSKEATVFGYEEGLPSNIVFPSSVTVESVTYVVTRIGDEAFKECTELSSVEFPTTITSIGDDAFCKSSVASVTIPSSVTHIGRSAFGACSNLASITIPDGVVSIGDAAFYGCNLITSIEIPASVTEIGIEAFSACSINSIIVDENNTAFDSRNGCNAIIDKSGRLIQGCNTTVIPSDVNCIANSAFEGCTGLTSITIPEGVEKIEGQAFDHCNNLSSVSIPNSVTSLGWAAFGSCAFASITIPEGITEIPSMCFAGCSNLTSVSLPSTITTILGGGFQDCTSLTSITLPESITIIEGSAFRYSGLTSITIPASVTKTIGDGAFYGCDYLTSVTMKNLYPVTITSEVFTNRANATLTVPAGSRDLYAAKEYWNEFRNIVQADIEDIERPQYYVDPETGVKYTPINGTPGEFYSHEGFASACDGDINTKFGTSVLPNGIIIEASEPVSLMGYTIITANDNADVNCHGRNPKSWTLEGSSDLETWTILDNQTDNMTMQDVNYTQYDFLLPAATNEYKYFRFTVNATQDAKFMQYSEIHLWQQTPLEIEGIRYSLDKDNHTATVINYNYSDKVVIPASVDYENNPYTVNGIANDAFKNCSIFTLISEIENPFEFGKDAFNGIPAGCILFVPAGTRDAYKDAGWTEEVFKGGVFEQGEMARRKVQELEVDNVTYSLYREVADWEEYRRDPDGTMLYSSKLTLEVTNGSETETYPVNDNEIYVAAALENVGGNEPMLIDMDSKQIFVFTHSKDEHNDYGFDGFAYVSPLEVINFQKEVVFKRSNQGHYSAFINVQNGRVAVSHFRSDGYYAMISTRSTEGKWITESKGFIHQDTYRKQIWPQQKHALITGTGYGKMNGAQYQAALEALPSGSQARIYTMYNEKKYYLTTGGTLTDSYDDAGLFTFTQTQGDNFYASTGWIMDVPFTNPQLTGDNVGDIMQQGAIQMHDGIRPDWEGKVFFKNGDKYAVRATNALSTLWGADTYWDVLDSNTDGQPEADYSLTPNFVWQMDVSALAEIDGFLYRLQNGTATLIRNENGNYSGEIEIPETVTFNGGEYAVIRIDDEAFSYYYDITSVTIPNGVKEIGNRAFAECSAITSLTLPNTLTEIGEKAFFNCYNIPSITLPKGLERIGYEAFYNCQNIKSIEIPATVTEIGVNPFVRCNQLATLTVAEGNTIYTAQNNSLLKGSTLITGNRDLTIPTGVTKIGQKAFEGIWGVETYSIPEGIESIEDMAFQECGFSSVTFPSTVTEITGNPFAGCGDLISLEVDENNPTYRSEGNCVIKDDVLVFGCKKTVIPANVTIISEKAFYWCYDLSSIVIPSTISSIGEEAFSECYNLKSVFVQWENPVPITSESTFSSRYDATLYVPAGTAGNYQNAEYWKDFSIKELHNDAECIDGIYYILDDVTKTALVTYKTYGEPSYSRDVELKSSIKVGGEDYAVVGIDNLAFAGCTELTSVSIPDGIVTISANAFYGCVGLSTLTLPISVTAIGNRAFYGCDNLASITVYWTGEESIPNIPDQTFSRYVAVLNVPSGKTELYRNKNVWGTFNITDAIVVDGIYYSLDETNNTATVARNVSEGGYSGNIEIPAKITVNNTVYDVTAIANEAFQWCDGLTSVTIPESVTSIGEYAFEGSWQATFKVKWDVPIAIYANSFDEGATIYVPLGTAELYKNADNWKNLSIYESHDGLESIDGIYYVLDETTHTAEVTYGGTEYEGIVVIPSTITVGGVDYTVNSIGNNAFEGCSKLTEVNIPSTVTSFREKAFWNCQNLTFVVVNWANQDDVPVIADNVFNWYDATVQVVKGTVDYYYDNRGYWNWFSYITDATRVDNLFYNLNENELTAEVAPSNSYRSLTEVVVPATITVDNQEYSVTDIGNWAFGGFQNLTSVTIPEGIKVIGAYAFYYCAGLTTIQLPNSITSIDYNAFYDCKNLSTISIPGSVTNIGYNAFRGTGITEITIPSSVTWIEGNPFADCKALETIVVESGNTTYDSRENCNAIIQTETNTLISACKNTAIPTSIKNIDNNAYWGCPFTAIAIPEGVVRIGNHAFMDCSNLETVVIPSTVTSIGERAFSGCDNLTNLNVKVVNPVELPLEKESYWHWDDNLQADVEVITYHEVFSDAAYANATLSVPAVSIEAYKVADYWKKFRIEGGPNFFATNAEGITTSKLLSSGESVALLDTYKSLVVEMDIEGMNEITYTRTFNNTEWQAIYLPFEMSYSDWSEDFEVARINDVHQFDDDEDGTIDRTLLEVIKLKDGSKTAANTPYVIKAKSVGDKTITVSNTKLYETVENVFSVSSWQTLYTFGTTYSTVSASVLSEPGYLVLGNGSLHPMNATSSDLSSFRWYLKVTDRDGNPKSQVNEVKLYVMGEDDDETNIGEISNSSNDQDSEVFDLSGRRLEKASGKGLYIINSKKVMVK